MKFIFKILRLKECILKLALLTAAFRPAGRIYHNCNTVYHPHCPQITHKHSQPFHPVYLCDLILRRTQGKKLKTERNIKKSRTRTDTSFILSWFRSRKSIKCQPNSWACSLHVCYSVVCTDATNKSVCSYLTCHLYWQTTDTEVWSLLVC